MDTVGYLLLAGLGFLVLKMLGGNPSSQLGSGVIPGYDPRTGAQVIDSSQFVGPIQSVPATPTASGQMYCPIGTRLYFDKARGSYICIQPSSVPAATQIGSTAAGAAAAASIATSTSSAAVGIVAALSHLFGSGSTPGFVGAPQPTLDQLSAGSATSGGVALQPTLEQLGATPPTFDTSSLPSNVPVDLSGLGITPDTPVSPTATVTLDYQASAPTPVPAPIVGVDPIFGGGVIAAPDPNTIPLADNFTILGV